MVDTSSPVSQQLYPNIISQEITRKWHYIFPSTKGNYANTDKKYGSAFLNFVAKLKGRY
jgi:hypothetical protein